MEADKVTFAQAAKLLNLHTNTLKNWQKAGKLPTAEKRKVRGVVTWLVDLDEVTVITNQGYTILDNGGDYQPQQSQQDGPEAVEQRQPEPSTQASQPTQIQPNIEATLTIFRESVVAPLTTLIKEQGNQIAELSAKNGQLEERLRHMEVQLQVAQAAQERPQQPEPSPVLNSETLSPEPPKKRHWWQF